MDTIKDIFVIISLAILAIGLLLVKKCQEEEINQRAIKKEIEKEQSQKIVDSIKYDKKIVDSIMNKYIYQK